MSLETLSTVTDYLFVAALVACFCGIAFCANEIERELNRHKKRTHKAPSCNAIEI